MQLHGWVVRASRAKGGSVQNEGLMPTPYCKLTKAQKKARVLWAKHWRWAHPEAMARRGPAKHAHYMANRDKYLRIERERAYVKLYGITIADYDRILKSQKGRCAICGTTKPSRTHQYFAVDHCHKTGIVRGLLCCNCNLRLDRWERFLEETRVYLTQL